MQPLRAEAQADAGCPFALTIKAGLTGEVLATWTNVESSWTVKDVLNRFATRIRPRGGQRFKLALGAERLRAADTLASCGISGDSEVVVLVCNSPLRPETRAAMETTMRVLEACPEHCFSEVAAMKAPPHGIFLTAQALCVLQGIEALSGDFWKAGKETFITAAKGSWLDACRACNPEALEDPGLMLALLEPVLNDEVFTPDRLRNCSLLCGNIHAWVLAIVEALREFVADE